MCDTATITGVRPDWSSVSVTIDASDESMLGSIAWTPSPDGYLVGWVDGKSVSLHRYLLLGTSTSPLVVDHIDRDKSNCRRSNLRTVTRAENTENTAHPILLSSSGRRGVSRMGNRWRAWIYRDGSICSLGLFNDPNDAIEARERAEKRKLQAV